MKFVFFFLFGFFSCFAIAQLPPTPLSIKHLLTLKKPVYHIDLVGNIIPLEILPMGLRGESQYLIKTSTNLYAGINGSGILIEISDSSGYMLFKRTDKTEHTGSNYFALNFCINDTIYSLGGYGFWRNHGQLRYFDETSKDWSIIKLNREIPTSRPTAWIDGKNAKVYLYGVNPISQFIKDSLFSNHFKLNELYQLDIRKGEWRFLGAMNKLLGRPYQEVNSYELHLGVFNSNAHPLGQLIDADAGTFVEDFRNNQRLVTKKAAINHFAKQFKYPATIRYYSDSTFYFGNLQVNSLDSMNVSVNDYIPIGEQVYRPEQSNIGSTNYAVGGFVAMGLLIASGLLYKYRFKKDKLTTVTSVEKAANMNTTDVQTGETVNPVNDNDTFFDQMETELIRFILKKSIEDYTASVSDINKILGLASKNEAVQKKNRSEKITRINQKWIELTGQPKELIHRKRSEFDKRSIEYYIREVDFEKLKIDEKLNDIF